MNGSYWEKESHSKYIGHFLMLKELFRFFLLFFMSLWLCLFGLAKRVIKGEIMSKKNTFISHRWDGSDDYDKIAGAVKRAGINPSDRSVPEDAPLDSKGNHLMHDIYSKIDSASVVFVPARPNSAKEGTVTRKEIEHAIEQGKTVIAVDTGATERHASFFAANNIPVVPARKDSIAKAVQESEKTNNQRQTV